MIHFKPNKMQHQWGKGLLTSVLGTTVSIILTFGTSALIDRKAKADIQRQTSMMVIHDIDVCVNKLEKMADEEEEMNNAVQYILAHQDQLASLPADTLELAMDMIADGDGINTIFDDAKENIFKSSQDIWSNLDNMAFIDNMERFYRERREIETYLTTDMICRAPISHEEYSQMRCSFAANEYEIDNAVVLKEKLKDAKVKFYIDFSPGRTNFYRETAQRWRDISDRNKFIMDISDEELADYIKNSQRRGSSVDKGDLIGQWHRKWSGGNDSYYEFKGDDTFLKKDLQYLNFPIWTGKIIAKTVIGGKWRLKGDTLFMMYDPNSTDVEIDTSHITYRPEMRDSVMNMIKRSFNLQAAKERLRKAVEVHTKDSFPVTTNKAHDKIEMVISSSEDNVKTRYMKRVKG